MRPQLNFGLIWDAVEKGDGQSVPDAVLKQSIVDLLKLEIKKCERALVDHQRCVIKEGSEFDFDRRLKMAAIDSYQRMIPFLNQAIEAVTQAADK
jgi:ASC-1-like (ASCH) protein